MGNGEWGMGNGEWGMEYFRFHTRDVPQFCQLTFNASVNRPNVTENRHLGEVTSATLTLAKI